MALLYVDKRRDCTGQTIVAQHCALTVDAATDYIHNRIRSISIGGHNNRRVGIIPVHGVHCSSWWVKLCHFKRIPPLILLKDLTIFKFSLLQITAYVWWGVRIRYWRWEATWWLLSRSQARRDVWAVDAESYYIDVGIEMNVQISKLGFKVTRWCCWIIV